MRGAEGDEVTQFHLLLEPDEDFLNSTIRVLEPVFLIYLSPHDFFRRLMVMFAIGMEGCVKFEFSLIHASG